MTESEYAIFRTMRAMAWERAKGELYSMLPTYYQIQGSENVSFDSFNNVLREIIKTVEDQELNL